MSQQPEDMNGWLAVFAQADIPVLRQTALALETLRADQRLLNASSIADVVTDDPLMTVKLLRYMQAHKSRHQMQELLDVKQMLLMMGMEAFFREVPATLIAEDQFDGHDAALPDDSRGIAEFLHMEPHKVMSLVKTGPAARLR